MPPNAKKTAQRRHAKRRAAQRFGVNVGTETLRAAVTAIQSGQAKHIETQSNRISVHELEIHGILMRVVYDKHRKEIVTVLRPGGQLQY